MATEHYCRLCAHKSSECISIFHEESIKYDLIYKIKQHLQIPLSPEDILPTTVCMACCAKVEGFSEYFDLCTRSQTLLMGALTAQDIKLDPEDTQLAVDENKTAQSFINSEFVEVASIPESQHFLPNDWEAEVVQEPPLEKEIDDNSSNVAQKNIPMTVISTPKESEYSDDGKSSFLSNDDDIFNEETGTQARSSFENYDWQCTDCDEKPNSLANLKIHHQTVHNQLPNFKCNECSKVYTRYRSFARHVKLHGDPKKYCCGICGKRFSQKTVLQAHSTVHSEDRPHVCSQCGKAFKQFSSLYLHNKCHLPEQAKPKFPCDVCNKVFSTKHTLDTHHKIHTGEKNFICDICGKCFIAKGSLDYHILTHNETKPHSCPVCGKGFKTSRLLSKHSSLHTGIKPHQCDVCGKQFRERGALKEHNRIHTGAMPYSCEFCGKLFRFKGILTVHRRQHTGERPYSCGECRREFTNWANCNKHMKRRHNKNSLPLPPQESTPNIHMVVNNLIQEEQASIVTPQPPPPYPDDVAGSIVYKLPEDPDIYRMSAYAQTPFQLPNTGYHLTHMQHPILQRDQ